MKVSFYGGAQEVTGTCFLFETESAGRRTKVVVDCGLFQCPHFCDARNHEKFPFDPASIDALCVTHAHIDHTGRIPKLVKDGFKGAVYSTPPTRDLAVLMLEDSLGVMKKQAHGVTEELLYGEEHIKKTGELWYGIPYGEYKEVGDFKIRFRNSAHVLGSAMVEVVAEKKKFVVTGDLGNPPTPLLKEPEKVGDANYLFIESVYGDKTHETYEQAKLKLERVIEDTVAAGGVLMIPAFSLERTQELLFDIHSMIRHRRIPKVPVFLDSPLAIKAVDIYKRYESYMDAEAIKLLAESGALFSFPEFTATLTTEESKRINDVAAPKIIIAGSGMSTGGRILHHERRYLPDEKSTILLMGYQAAGSRGRKIQDGHKEIEILGEKVLVRARVETLSGYSGHADRDRLFDFVAHTRDSLRKVFVVQGEPASSLFLVQRIRDNLGVDALAPRYGQSFELK